MIARSHMILDMAPEMKWTVNIALLAFSSLVLIASTHAKLRKLETTVLCPNSHFCRINTDNLVYTKAVGSNDTLHYLYSTKDIPTVLVVQTDPNGKLLVDWTNFDSMANNSISFTGTIQYSYAILITKLLEYNDVNDTADLSDPDLNKAVHHNWNIRDFASLKVYWSNANLTSNASTHEVVFVIKNTTYPKLFNDQGGSLQFKFKAYDIDGRNPLLPHLAYTGNTTQIDVSLDNLASTFNNSRFAVEMYMISNLTGLQENSTADLEMSRSIDDEHSPGVFEIIDWTSGGSDQTQGGYMQWKPVCYTSSARSFADLSKAKHYKLHVINNTSAMVSNSTIAFAFFGGEMYGDKVSVSATNVSFGISKDKFYKNTNYVVWSASFGLGMPPADKVSPMILIVISLGLGLPVLLIVMGGIGITVKRMKGDGTPYGTIN